MRVQTSTKSCGILGTEAKDASLPVFPQVNDCLSTKLPDYHNTWNSFARTQHLPKTQILKRRHAITPDCEELELIERHIFRISNIVRQLSLLARPFVDHWECTVITLTLEKAVKLVAFDKRANHIKITISDSLSLPSTMALRGQLQQVFINLLLNALDAMPDGGSLTVSGRKKGRNILIQFKDTGSGIPADIGRRIFEPFFTTKQPGHGTGMGLSVSYGIIHKHGGTIDFISREGGDTIFTIELPILQNKPGG